MNKSQNIPQFLQSTLWSFNLANLDPEKDKSAIISQILNHGSWKDLQWILKTYSLNDIKEVIKKPKRGIWMDDVLNYWTQILDIDILKKKREEALFSLDLK